MSTAPLLHELAADDYYMQARFICSIVSSFAVTKAEADWHTNTLSLSTGRSPENMAVAETMAGSILVQQVSGVSFSLQHAITKQSTITRSLDEITDRINFVEHNPEEYALSHQFAALVRSLDDDIESWFIADPRADEIREPHEFHLVALATDTRGALSSHENGFGKPIDDPMIAYKQHDTGYPPQLDSRLAIGIAFKDRLVAFASAGVDEKGMLFINQIEGMRTVRERGRVGFERFLNESGLHHGFLWRHTLVNCWEEIARRVGCPAVIIQSHKNNMTDIVRERGYNGYDKVADDMGYDPWLNDDLIKFL